MIAVWPSFAPQAMQNDASTGLPRPQDGHVSAAIGPRAAGAAPAPSAEHIGIAGCSVGNDASTRTASTAYSSCVIRLSSEPDASPADIDRISDAINEWNMATTGLRDYRPVAIFLRDDEGAIRGGVTGGVWGGWLHIVGLWVDEDLRGRGFGRELVLAAEAEGRAAGARASFLETHSFQAPGLYRKLGYEAFGELEDYPPGASQLFMRKDLR